ncbi:GntR family transcriptional regulator [Conexibacter woesei]|uniref:Transcriptional regulator, GntR family n=1 Tax=Conexibacter woesei (strain DSM 14684 / CCUG 47730 / CIP 108061 / JCM 11494 / NBRC 100937 / ID131577) TaxID=469383 RepID=D3FAM4_CONWI|nr:GntR family transcriptional regulator [Conexibacter woesei]ADB51187.1 transcriptional regulator, GntR family [Conexibacter woesei DSM 14684]
MSRQAGGSSLVEHVHRELREDILDGRYAAGAHLRLGELAAEHGVSFIPIREALRRLEGERLVEVERNRGARVAPLSLEDARDVYASRIVVEAHALRLAFPRLTDAELSRSAAAIDAMTTLFEAGRSREAYAQHRIVHFAIYEAAESPWTLHLIAQLWAGAERYVRRSAALRGTPQEFAAEHRAVLAAVEAGDEDAAVQRLEEHLRKTQALLEGVVEPTLETE